MHLKFKSKHIYIHERKFCCKMNRYQTEDYLILIPQIEEKMGEEITGEYKMEK